MKLLLVDDETYTREGIAEDINWEILGISEVVQASNGVKAFEIAKNFLPDILLTDVRMPQMTGIDLAYNIQNILPDCSIIFMSGFSDKDYLKAAIDLKAVNYVEKPLDLDELSSTIQKAVELCKNLSKTKRHFLNSTPILKNDLALKLIKPSNDNDSIITMLNDFYPMINKDFNFHTIIFKLINEDSLLSSNANIKDVLNFYEMETFLNKLNINCMFGFRDKNYLIAHISYSMSNIHSLNNELLETIFQVVNKSVSVPNSIYMAVGQKVSEIFDVHISYNTAVIALQKIFFRPTRKILIYSNRLSNAYIFDEKIVKEFSEYILQGNKEKAIFVVKKLSADLRTYDGTLDKTIRDFYFKFLLELIIINDASHQDYIADRENVDMLWDTVSNFIFLDKIEDFVIQKIEDYFKQFYKLNATNFTSNDIVRYIHTNYADPELSLRKISEVTFLSAPYICVIFKKETGKTLVQYITEFRVEKSIELLKNKLLKVNDIADRVGFNDGNYYAKAFKKVMGLSPTDYREKYFYAQEND